MLLSEKWDTNLFKDDSNKKDSHALERCFVFVADSQYAGRGQRDNQWVSPEGNIYMTMLVRIP